MCFEEAEGTIRAMYFYLYNCQLHGNLLFLYKILQTIIIIKSS